MTDLSSALPSQRSIQHIAVLDDYEGRVHQLADWTSLAQLGNGAARLTCVTDLITDADALVECLRDKDCVVLMRGRTRLTGEILRRLPKLKLIVTTGGRIDPAIDVTTATELGIQLCGTSTLGHPTAELVWGLLIGLWRHIPRTSEMLRSERWMPRIGRSLHGQTLGIIGLGRIGSQVARVALAFDMKVLAWSRNLDPAAAIAKGVSAVDLDTLLRESDAVTLHVHGNERYRGLLGARELGLMQSHAVLINTARAAIVDQQALLSALIERRIGGAALDVYDHEPLPRDHAFLKLDNVLATPHLGYVTEDNFRFGYEQIVASINAYMVGDLLRPLNQIKPEGMRP